MIPPTLTSTKYATALSRGAFITTGTPRANSQTL